MVDELELGEKKPWEDGNQEQGKYFYIRSYGR